MIRRQFIRRTLGAIAGAVCAGFVGKAGLTAEYVIGCDVATGEAAGQVTYMMTRDGLWYCVQDRQLYRMLDGPREPVKWQFLEPKIMEPPC